MISDEALKEFKAIWQMEEGELPSEDELIDEAVGLLLGFNTVYRPVKKEWVNENSNENTEPIAQGVQRIDV
jgi:hypothetical protein